jgi:hypothetical protein
LRQLTIPSTHDSGSYNLTKDIVPDYIKEEYIILLEAAEKLGLPVDVIISAWGKS